MENYRPNGPPPDEPFSHNILDRDPASRRALQLYRKPILMTTVMISLVIWSVLALYWGEWCSFCYTLSGWRDVEVNCAV